MKNVVKGLLASLLSIPQSKRVLIVALTWVLGKVGFLPPAVVDVLAEHSYMIIMALLVATGISDAGKALAVKVSPSLAPAVTAPSVSGGVAQVIDPEDPIRDRR